MAASLAKGFSSMGTAFIIVAPVLGFIGVALSGSNTSTNAMFGKFQALVGAQLGMPPLLLPTLNSVGAEIGKPIAPRSEEHTSELQSRSDLVCRLLLEKKKTDDE